jgi:hypothetical protein
MQPILRRVIVFFTELTQPIKKSNRQKTGSEKMTGIKKALRLIVSA